MNTDTVTTHEAQLIQSEIFTLSEVQRTALDLHRRGFNVMPLPRKHLVKNWAAKKPAERSEYDKPPYVLNPFFTSRLHLCGIECFRKEQQTGRRCVPEHLDFVSLFEGENIGVMTGRTSGNLVSADCDDKAKFEWVRSQAAERELPHMAYATHQGGQVLFRIIEGEATNVKKEKSKISNVEIWGNSHYCVLPPSIHPRGTVYQWVTKAPAEMATGETLPAVPVDSLSWLGVTLKVGKGRGHYEAPELFNLPEWTALLSLKNRRILASASQIANGERNANFLKPVYAIAARIQSGDVSYNDGLAVLEIAGRACGQDAKAMLNSAVKKQGLNIETNNKVHTLKAWERAAEFMQSHDWAGHYGRSAQGARAVFDACIQRAKMDQSETFRATMREIADNSNFATHKRAIRIMKLLRTKQPTLIKWVGEAESNGAYLYTFESITITQKLRNDPSIPTIAVYSGVISQSPKTQAQKDVFRAFGQVAWQVWQYLLISPTAKKNVIAKSIGQQASSVGRAIEVLTHHGLVIFGEGVFYGEPKTDNELERLSAVLGTLGRADKTRRQFTREREIVVSRAISRSRQYWKSSYMSQSIHPINPSISGPVESVPSEPARATRPIETEYIRGLEFAENLSIKVFETSREKIDSDFCLLCDYYQKYYGDLLPAVKDWLMYWQLENYGYQVWEANEEDVEIPPMTEIPADMVLEVGRVCKFIGECILKYTALIGKPTNEDILMMRENFNDLGTALDMVDKYNPRNPKAYLLKILQTEKEKDDAELKLEKLQEQRLQQQDY